MGRERRKNKKYSKDDDMERKRTKSIHLQLSDEEWDHLKENVAITGLTTQSYLRAREPLIKSARMDYELLLCQNQALKTQEYCMYLGVS